MLQDTIAAISTALADGAISIVRVSGDDAIEIVNNIFDRDLKKAHSHTVTYGYIIEPDTNEAIDEVLVTVFKEPKTFTREDIVEINCHGGEFVTRKILTMILAQGARLAEPGEFTRRAFINGRIDLTQAEAIHDIIQARQSSSAKLAIHGIRGSVKKLLEPLIQDILDIIANIEVNIDYPEYDDVEQLTSKILIPKAQEWLSRIDKILKRSQSGKIMREGIKTAIVGKPNVGKSSLLNALLEEEKAIVTDVAGTTRDIVEGSIQLENLTLHLIDTAGIRETKDLVEKIGIERSKKAIEEAELVILVLDASAPLDEVDQELLAYTKDKMRIIVYNKHDIHEERKGGVMVSAVNQEIDELLNKLHEMYDQHLIALKEPVLSNERQISLLMKANAAMKQAHAAMLEGMELDLVSIDIQEAYTSLKEILGEVHREDLLDTLFSNFCLGK